MTQIKSSERGAMLLLAVTMVVMLTLMGALVMRTVGDDVQVAGAERSADSALYIAEAGLQWARVQIADPNGYNGDLNQVLTALTAVPVGDSDVPLRGWLELGSQNYGDGTFRVVLQDDAYAETDPPPAPNNTILVRSLGTSARGSKRLLEVALEVP